MVLSNLEANADTHRYDTENEDTQRLSSSRS
jgi:hypothetical protein